MSSSFVVKLRDAEAGVLGPWNAGTACRVCLLACLRFREGIVSWACLESVCEIGV